MMYLLGRSALAAVGAGCRRGRRDLGGLHFGLFHHLAQRFGLLVYYCLFPLIGVEQIPHVVLGHQVHLVRRENIHVVVPADSAKWRPKN